MEDNNIKWTNIVYRKHDKIKVEENPNADFGKRVVCTITQTDTKKDELERKRNIEEYLIQDNETKKFKTNNNLEVKPTQKVLFGTNNYSYDWNFVEIELNEMYDIIRKKPDYSLKTNEEIDENIKHNKANYLYDTVTNKYKNQNPNNYNIILDPSDFINYFIWSINIPLRYIK